MRLLLSYVFVFCTGASGLVYQVTWHRYLSRLLGSDSIATAIILATFLGGLSLGYFLCGKISARLKLQHHFKAYAIAQAVIGVWCLFFPSIFHSLSACVISWSFAPPVLILLQGITCSVLLMGVPTVCMGATLPFLTRAISCSLEEATTVHARIYAINTFGAFLGTLLAGFYLIPRHGLPQSIMMASFVNLLACLFFYALPVDVLSASPERTEDPEHFVETVRTDRTFPSRVLYLLALLSGVYVMTLENVLIRLTGFAIGSTSYTFSLIVAVFILAIAVGSSVVSRLRDISHRVLFFNQLAITLFLVVIYGSLDTWSYWAHIVRSAFQSNAVGFWWYYGAVFVVLLGLLIIPVACMGATIPLLFHEAKRDLKRIGKHSGIIFAWNTLGNLVGSLVGGIVLFYLFNNDRVFLSAVLLAACSVGVVGWYLKSPRYRLSSAVVVGLACFLIVTSPYYETQRFKTGTFRYTQLLPYSLLGPDVFYRASNQGRKLLFYKDGPMTSVAVTEVQRADPFSGKMEAARAILVNGKPDSDVVGDRATLKLLAHLPALLADSREQVLVIGLGTGVTAGELTLYRDIGTIDVAEISPMVIKALPLFDKYNYQLHTRPNVHIHTGDAFRILGRSSKRWNIVISEPSNPWVTGVDSLFSLEFYRAVKQRLARNGVLMQWIHRYSANLDMLGMVLNTVHQEFAYVHVFVGNPGDLLVVASNSRFSPRDLARADQLLQDNPAVRKSLETISRGTLDAILLTEVWTTSYVEEQFSRCGLQTLDNPFLHYIAGKCVFVDASVSDNALLTAMSPRYLDEYLAARRYEHWRDFGKSENLIEAVLNQSRLLNRAARSLKLRAYLTDAARHPLSVSERASFQVDVLGTVTDPARAEKLMDGVEPGENALRRKIEPLLEHVGKFRDWLVPYPVDGLRLALQEGIRRAADAHERNWFRLQLVLLLTEEHADPRTCQSVLAVLERDGRGHVLLRSEDMALALTLQEYYPPLAGSDGAGRP